MKAILMLVEKTLQDYRIFRANELGAAGANGAYTVRAQAIGAFHSRTIENKTAALKKAKTRLRFFIPVQ